MDRDQQRGELYAEYIRALIALVENCGYEAAFRKEMVRDKLLNGMRDRALATLLRANKTCTADLVKKEMLENEAAKEEEPRRQRDKAVSSNMSHQHSLDELSSREVDAIYRGGTNTRGGGG